MTDRAKKPMEQVIRENGRYPPQAYSFLQEGMQRATREVYGEKAPPGHVSGAEICNALKELAIQQWGMLARTVLAKWNIHATIDFGNMVYLLIEHGHFGKDDEDSIDHFRDVYDFAEAFGASEDFEVSE